MSRKTIGRVVTSAERIARLDGWVSEPYVLNRVIAAARSMGHPFRLSEIAREARLPYGVVFTRLARLIEKGLVSCCRLPCTWHLPCPRTRKANPGRSTRVVRVYYWIGD